MTTLFSGLQVVVGGVQAERVLSIPSDIKQPGVPLTIRVTMDSSVFPLGTTTLGIGISKDNQASYKSASMTCPGSKSGVWEMFYSLGPDDAPTHTRIGLDATLGFSSNMTVEAL